MRQPFKGLNLQFKPPAALNAPGKSTCDNKSAAGQSHGKSGQCIASSEESLYYSVMYCPWKRGKVRKGPWSDGLLEMRPGGTCVLSNMEAKVVGKTACRIKLPLEEGSLIQVWMYHHDGSG